MKKVICIDAGDKRWCINHGMIPLNEGTIYTVRSEHTGKKGDGYLLEEIINGCNIVDAPGKEPGYLQNRFIPLSDIDETEMVREKLIVEVN